MSYRMRREYTYPMEVTALVPAYNEAPRIGRVLETLATSPGFKEIIVADDGSDDGTEEVAAKWATVLRTSHKGKGEALSLGVSAARGECLFFCDADIIGLTHVHIDAILSPVLSGQKEMSVGVRAEKMRRFLWWEWTPLLDGQRAVTRALWERVPAEYKRGHRMDLVLNHYAQRSTSYCVIPVQQVVKEEKRGWLVGRWHRIAMYFDLFCTHVELLAKGRVKVFEVRRIPSGNTLFQ